MSKLKFIVVAALAVCMTFVFTACGSEPFSNVDLDEYIKVGKYKGLETESFKVKVTDKEVDQQIQQNLQAAAKTEEVTKGTVKDGDTLNIDYVGKINGKEFEGGSAQGYQLVIGSKTFIDGFESGLVGAKVGEKKTLKLKFPKNYQEKKLAGKDVTFDVTINSKQETVTPKLDEDFVKEQMKNDAHKDDKKKIKTVADYKAHIKEHLEEQKQEEGVNTQKSNLWSQVVATSELKKDDDKKEKYPEEEVKKIEEQITTQYEDYAKQQNMKLEDFLQQQMQMDKKTFKKQVKEYAKSTVKENLIVFKIAENEDIEVSDDEYEKYIKDQLEKYGYTEESYEKQTGKSFEEANGEESIKTQIYKDKVLDFILDKAKIVEPKKDKKK